MPTSRERLASKLVRIRSIAERQEIMKVEAERDRLQAAEEHERACLTRQMSLSDDFRQKATAGMAGSEMMAWAALVSASQRSVEAAATAREEAAQREREATAKLLDAVRQRQAAEKLAERAQAEAQRAAAQREQRALDEIAMQKTAREMAR